MIILVADTSVLVDLEHGGLLQVAFASGLMLVVPDLLYDYELEARNGRYLRELGLVVVELSPEELTLAQQLKARHTRLSLPDCFALSCAHRQNHELTTGDRSLRKIASDRGVPVHGVLWLLDLLESRGVDKPTLAQGLMAIRDHPKCLLPADEVEARIAAWL